jgi:HK97 family phage prohead protease
MKDILRLSYGFEVRALVEDTRSVDVIASTAAIDGYGEIVAQDWDLKRFLANPVVLYGHNAWDMPIGYATDVRVDDGKLRATLNFVDEKASPTAERVWQGIRQGSLRAVSVGFRAGQVTSRSVGEREVLVLTGNELLEISVVPLPANPEAVMVAEKSINIIRALAKAGACTEQNNMNAALKVSTVLALLALPDTATEAEVADRIKSFERSKETADGRARTAEEQVAKLLGAVGAKSLDEALGAIEAAKSASAQLADQVRKTETLERAKLISDAKIAKKLLPHQEKGLEGRSLDFVRGFIELLAPNPILVAEDPVEPSTPPSTSLTHEGKSWEDMSFDEKHDLYFTSPELYKAMRDAARAH